MSRFTFTAQTADHQVVQGHIEALSRDAAVNMVITRLSPYLRNEGCKKNRITIIFKATSKKQ